MSRPSAQYAGVGSGVGSAGFGQADVFEPQHVFVFVSQHCTPPARAGQPVAQSASVAQVDGHVLGGGVVAGVAAGNFVSGGAGSVGDVSSAGTSALFAQAVAIRTAVTANADFDKVAYFTRGTIGDELQKNRPDRLTLTFAMIEPITSTPATPEKQGNARTYIGAKGQSETRKKSRRPLLELALLFAIGAALFSPAVLTPLFLDDYLQGAMVEGTFPSPRSPFNLYDFVNEHDRATLTERGLLPWWSHPKLAIRFFRPLSSALLWVDHRVFSHAALPMHLHSLFWWAAAVLAVRALYRRVFAPRVTLLATAIFALAPCHALPHRVGRESRDARVARVRRARARRAGAVA